MAILHDMIATTNSTNTQNR